MDRKLVVFVPAEALDRVRDALFEAGAGRIGDYERCSWYAEGTGTFLGREGTQPSIGEAYISTGSLYLCSVALLPLGLPDTDPFWSAPAQPWTSARAWSGRHFPIDHAL